MAKQKNIFLTGGAGFIGKNIVEQLEGKYQIFAPPYRELDLLNALSVEKFLASHPVDVVIHAANIGGTRKDAGLANASKVNMEMFLNLARQNKYFGKMIFFGSGAEYDKRRDLKKVQEQEFGKSIPADEYGFAKYSCSKFIETADNIISLRCFGVYGKYEDYTTRFISYSICRAILGLPLSINQNVVYDYLYIKDLIKIVDFFIKNKSKEKFYNIGTGQATDLLGIAGIIKEVSGKDLPIKGKIPGLNKEYTCNNSRLLAEMPGLEFTPMRKAIVELYKWYNKNRDNWKPDLITSSI